MYVRIFSEGQMKKIQFQPSLYLSDEDDALKDCGGNQKKRACSNNEDRADDLSIGWLQILQSR